MMKTKTLYFNHIYDKSGFDVSAEMMSDGKEYITPQRHSCLRHGHWCWENFFEYPLDIFKFIKFIKLNL